MPRLVDAFEQFFDSSGEVLASGLVDFFESGSNTVRKTTYADSGETIPNPNPVVLNGDGRAPNVWGSGTYRAVLRTFDSSGADGDQILSRDPVGGDNNLTFGADWNALQVYSISDVVRDDGQYWISQTNNNLGNQPSTDGGTNWIQIVVDFQDVVSQLFYGSYAEVRDINTSTLSDGQMIFISGFGHPWEVKTGTVTDDGWYLVFTDDSNRYAESTSPDILVEIFGASSSSDSTTNVQNAIDYAKGLVGRTRVTGMGGQILLQDEVFLKTGVVLADIYFLFNPTLDDKIAINVGYQDGSELVRPAGVENVEVEVDSSNTQNGIIGFNFGHGARACWIRECRARMRGGTPTTNTGNIGFSFFGIRDDLVIAGGGVNGCYQNTLSGCVVNGGDVGYRISTDGFGDVGFKAQMNANFIKNCSAYACKGGGILVGEGAQDNIIEVRADNFVDAIGDGTTIIGCEVRGSFNDIKFHEEMGLRGDTQYPVAFQGDNPRYNYVEYTTQSGGTDDVFFNETTSAVGKNVANNVARPINVNGGDIFTTSGRENGPAGATTTISEVQITTRCLLVKAVASNIATPASFTRFNFAKNGSNDTVQRLTWDNADAVRTTKTLDSDAGTSSTIDGRFIYEEGDYIRLQIEQDGTAANEVSYTLYFKSLHRN